MRVLLTGANGFVGKNLFRQLWFEEGVKLFSVYSAFASTSQVITKGDEAYLNLSAPNHVEILFKALGYADMVPDVIIHTAARPLVSDQSSDMVATNVLGTYNLLAHCPPHAHFVYLSSASVYGSKGRDFTEFDQLCPESPYAQSKVAAEGFVQTMARIHGFNWSIIRPSAIVGGFGATHGLLPDLVRKSKGLAEGEPLPLLGHSPGSKKPFVHVEDLCAFVEKLIRQASPSGLYNICSEGQVGVDEVAEFVMRKRGLTPLFSWSGSAGDWVGDQKNLSLSGERSREVYQYKHPTSRGAVERAVDQLLEGEAMEELVEKVFGRQEG